MNYGDILADFRRSAPQAPQVRVGNRPMWQRSSAARGGVGAQTPGTGAPTRPDASGTFRDRKPGGGKKGCGDDPVSTRWGGLCVCQPGECEYDPAIFCGWSALPFSTFKDQGAVPLSGPVVASFGAIRTIRITAERACLFRIRGVWFRSVESADATTTGMSMLANVRINETPRVIEIGGIGAAERIGIPSSLFDNGICFVLPTDWGILDPIQNNSRPLELDFMTPAASNQDIVGVLFGDPLIPGTMEPYYGNYMLM